MKIAAIGFFIILILILISFAVINLVRTIRYNDTSSESQELAEKARKTSASSEQKIDPILRSKRKKEQDMQYMREAGVAEDEISYTEIIYDTGDGYGGKLITYIFRNNQFYYHPYMWHIDDSQEFEESVPCSPEQAVSIIANCNHSSKSKIPSINRIAAISGIDVSVITLKKKTSEPQQANSAEKTFSLLGGGRYGTSARMRRTDKGFEVIVEYHAPNPFEHFGTSAIVPSEIIGQMSLQALQNWMYTITTPAFHEEITAKEEEYRQFLRECGVKYIVENNQRINSTQTVEEDNSFPALSTQMCIEIGNTLEKYYLNDECSEVEIHFLKECVNFNPGGEGVDKLFRFDKTVNMFYSVYYHWDAGNPRNEHYYSREFLDPVYFRSVLQNFRADKLRSDPYDEENMHEVYRIFDHISEMLMSWISPVEPYQRFFEKSSDDTFSVTDTDALPKYAEPNWEFLCQAGQASCAADAATVSKYYRDPKTDSYYQTDIYGRVLISLTKEQVESIQQKQA